MVPTLLPDGEYHHTGLTVIWASSPVNLPRKIKAALRAARRRITKSLITEKSLINRIGLDLMGRYCKSHNMLGLIQRFLGPPGPGVTEITENNGHPRVLAVTADIGFYAGVLNAASSARWRTEWARTLNRAIEVCRSKSPQIVIYDSTLPGVEWGWAFDQLSALSSHPRILLAAPSIDEELWRNVLRRHGYDVVERAASSEQLGRELRFAWLSLLTPADV